MMGLIRKLARYFSGARQSDRRVREQPAAQSTARSRRDTAADRIFGHAIRNDVDKAFQRADRNSGFEQKVDEALGRIAKAQSSSERSIDAVSGRPGKPDP